MGILILYIILTLVLIAAISLLKVYRHIPLKEVRRRAARNDKYAQLLYRVTSYGMSVDIVLWFIVGVAATALYVAISTTLTWYLAAPYIAAIIWFASVWLPAGTVGTLGVRLAKVLSPFIARVVSFLHPYLGRIADRIKKLRPVHVHTGLYEKEDLLELFDRQKTQLDSRIGADELSAAKGALTYADKLVRDYMTPRSMIVMAHVNDSIGPTLLNELHASGHSRFPVYDQHADHVVGTLYLRDTVDIKGSKPVGDVMSKTVYYIHEDESLQHALRGFLAKKHHLFMVVNSFEELTGIITIEDIIEQIIGKQIVDESDVYESIREVALGHAEKLAKNRDHVTIPTDEMVTKI